MTKTLLLLAGGSGTRMGAAVNKVLLPIAGVSCIRRCLDAFRPFTDRLVLVCRPQDEEALRMELSAAALSCPMWVVYGGSTRQASVLAGLQAVSWQEADLVMVHDAARCLVPPEVIRRAVDCCMRNGNGIPCIPVTDTVKLRGCEGQIDRTLSREALLSVQTPQVFRGQELLSLSLQALAEGFLGTDDASLLEHAHRPVFWTEGSIHNLKLTNREDIMIANVIAEAGLPAFRVGHGYDVHQLTEGRKLILCGVEIPFEKGLLGHSDADVALHALMDALLGAAALGDIGQHFPDRDPQYAGISSMKLLEKTLFLLRGRGLAVGNVDLTIAAQRPRLAPFIPEMRQKTAAALSLPLDRVSIKATTTEHLGFEGRGEGISAQAVCLLCPAP